MTLRLILMRHAKSSWDDPRIADHDRVLNGRGRAAAKAIGDWLKANNYVPDQIVSSSARRTIETAELLDFGVDIEAENALYHAGAETMLRVLQKARGTCVLMLGHNPGIADFAERLMRQAPEHPRFFDYPTASTLVVDFDVATWDRVSFGQGMGVNFVTPRDLD